VSDGVEAIVSQALAKRPDDRFANVGAMGSALEAELLALTRDDGSETAEVPLVTTALEVAEPSEVESGRILQGEPDDESELPPRLYGRRLWPIGLLVLVLAAGIGWAAYLGSSLSDGNGAASTSTPRSTATTTPGTTATTATTAATAATGALVTGLTASSYDPTGDGGDGSEHPADTANVLDGNPATIWRTDTYTGSPKFNGSKPGVGLILTAATAVAAAALHLQAGIGDWTGRVYTAPGTSPPASIAGWTPVSEPFSARTVPMDVPLTGGPSRLYLIWITKLAPTETGSGFAASIIDAQLRTAA